MEGFIEEEGREGWMGWEWSAHEKETSVLIQRTLKAMPRPTRKATPKYLDTKIRLVQTNPD